MWFVQWDVEHGPPGTICVDQDMILKGDGHTCMNIVFFSSAGLANSALQLRKGSCVQKKSLFTRMYLQSVVDIFMGSRQIPLLCFENNGSVTPSTCPQKKIDLDFERVMNRVS